MYFAKSIRKAADSLAIPSVSGLSRAVFVRNQTTRPPILTTQYKQIVTSPNASCFEVSREGILQYKMWNSFKFKDEPVPDITSRSIKRDDPILIKVVQELGKEASTEHSNLVVRYYKAKYANFLEIGDGRIWWEGASIDVDAYKFATIESVADSLEHTAEEKVQQIKAVLRDQCEDAKVYASLPEGGYVVN